MRLSDMFTTPAKFAEAVKAADQTSYQAEQAAELTPLVTKKGVGVCYLEAEGEDTVKIGIIWVSEFKDHPIESKHTPFAHIIRYVSGDIFIEINDIAYQYLKTSPMEGIGIGLLGHELGHYLAGHLNVSLVEKSKVESTDPNTVDYEQVTQAMVDGTFEIPKVEREANLEAMRLVGIAPIIALFALFATTSISIGLRLMNSQMLEWIFQVVADMAIIPSKYTFNYVLLEDTDEETPLEEGLDDGV